MQWNKLLKYNQDRDLYNRLAKAHEATASAQSVSLRIKSFAANSFYETLQGHKDGHLLGIWESEVFVRTKLSNCRATQ